MAVATSPLRLWADAGRGQGTGGASSVAAVDACGTGGVLLIELGGLEVDSLGEATSPAWLPER